jgi:undecaprenyl-diphosphatase
VDEASGATTAARPIPSRLYPWLVAGGLLAILAVLTVNVLTHGPLVSLDRRIREAVLAHASSPGWRWLVGSPYAPAHLVADLGDPRVAVPVLAATAVVLAARHRTRRPLITAGVGVVLLLATVVSAKFLIGRPGPGRAVLAPGVSGSFPSGHTTTACVCYSLAVLLLIAGRPPRIRRFALAGLAVLWLLIGAALVWCDYHWFTDVVAGWALAAIIVQLSLRL